MKLTEPVTAITDFLLALEVFFLGVLLFLKSGEQTSIRLWATAFVSLGMASTSGGLLHGFRKHWSPALTSALLKITAFGIAGCVGFLLLGGIQSSRLGALKIPVLILIGSLIVFATSRMSRPKPARPAAATTLSFLGILFVCLLALLVRQFLTGGATSGIWILSAILVSLVSIAVQQAKIDLHPHMNHNDLCHVIQMVAMVLFYQAGLRLRGQ